jgi:hypothetical protein
MRWFQVWLISLFMILAPVAAQVHMACAEQEAPPSGLAPPPVAQPLVREGDLAVHLVTALNLGQTSNEAEAESILTRAGIAPSNGWIADYPVTPDVVVELLQGIRTAAASGRIAMSEADAEQAFNEVNAGLGLSIAAAPAEPQQESVSSTPPPDNTLYESPTTVNNYYYQYGPPVVTYYPPPPYYSYLYAWVPYPFFYMDFWFPGYYCLHDFDRVVVVGPYVRVVTNHWYDPHRHAYVIVRPPYWNGHPGRHDRDRYHRERFTEPSHGFSSPYGRRDAEAILRRQVQRRPGEGDFRGPAPEGGRAGEWHTARPGVLRPEGPASGLSQRPGRGGSRNLIRPAPAVRQAPNGGNDRYGPSSSGPGIDRNARALRSRVPRAPEEGFSRSFSGGAVEQPRPRPQAGLYEGRVADSAEPGSLRAGPPFAYRSPARSEPPRGEGRSFAGREAGMHRGGLSLSHGRSPGGLKARARPSPRSRF